MATITKFEDLEIWQLARTQTNDFDELHDKNVTLGNKMMAFITYLQNSSFKGQRYKSKE